MKLGIDIGGTDVKFAVVDGTEIIYKNKISTVKDSAENFVLSICEELNRISQLYPYETVGIGTAGSVIDGVVYAGNLPLKHYPLAQEIEKRVGKKPVIDNDANCAAYGEYLFGKKYRDMALITIGTGIGGGIVMDGKLCRGHKGFIAEFGHIIINAKSDLSCPCGQKGCLEQYASATALVRQATEAVRENPDSLLAKLYADNGKLNGKLIFQALSEKCKVAEKVFDEYLDWLAVGIKSIRMVLNPDAIVLAGGITKEGDKLLLPLKEKLPSDINVLVSVLQDDAGVFGAANLI